MGDRELVTELKKALVQAETTIMEQDLALEQLTAEPLSYAVVLSTKPPSTKGLTKKEARKGRRVRIMSSRYHESDLGKVGSIISTPDGDGEVMVRYESKNEERVENLFGIGMPRAYNPNKEVALVGTEGSLVVSFGGQQLEVIPPFGKTVKAGDTVKLSVKTMQVVDVVDNLGVGETTIVRRVIDPNTSEVDFQGTSRVVVNGKEAGALHKGDRIVLDTTGSVALRNLGKDDERFNLEVQTNVSWDDIGGLVDAKQQMIEAIELPHKYPDLYHFYGKKPLKGILLFGPPGCGKTLLAKAAATALAKTYGKTASHGFIYIKGPEILDRYVGTSEGLIRHIFQRARKHRQDSGYPAVIFVDEADAILGRRGMGISSDIERTIVPMFLAEMDGLEDSGAIVLLATNRADVLDPAIVRDGRIDRKIKVCRPDENGARDIFALHLKGIPLKNGYTHADMAKFAATELFSATRALYQVSLKEDGSQDRVVPFTLADLVNGAMIAGVVDQATSIALHRDIKNRRRGGLAREDIATAFDRVFAENVHLNHEDALSEKFEENRHLVTHVRRVQSNPIN